MTILDAVILGIVEGITEFLPVSSTGHLILTANLLRIPQSAFAKTFEVFIQIGAIFAVFTLFWKKLIKNPHLFKQILIAFVPTGILGLLFYKIIKQYLFTSVWIPALTLALVGFILILLEKYFIKNHKPTETIETLSPQKLLGIGLAQSISMVPGVSRAAASIIGGMISGLSRKDAVEFSFFLAVPTIAAAAGLDILQNLEVINNPDNLTLLILGTVVSWIVATLVMKLFLSYVARATFTVFGVYRIAIALLYLAIIA